MDDEDRAKVLRKVTQVCVPVDPGTATHRPTHVHTTPRCCALQTKPRPPGMTLRQDWRTLGVTVPKGAGLPTLASTWGDTIVAVNRATAIAHSAARAAAHAVFEAAAAVCTAAGCDGARPPPLTMGEVDAMVLATAASEDQHRHEKRNLSQVTKRLRTVDSAQLVRAVVRRGLGGQLSEGMWEEVAAEVVGSHSAGHHLHHFYDKYFTTAHQQGIKRETWEAQKARGKAGTHCGIVGRVWAFLHGVAPQQRWVPADARDHLDNVAAVLGATPTAIHAAVIHHALGPGPSTLDESSAHTTEGTQGKPTGQAQSTAARASEHARRAANAARRVATRARKHAQDAIAAVNYTRAQWWQRCRRCQRTARCQCRSCVTKHPWCAKPGGGGNGCFGPGTRWLSGPLAVQGGGALAFGGCFCRMCGQKQFNDTIATRQVPKPSQ